MGRKMETKGEKQAGKAGGKDIKNNEYLKRKGGRNKVGRRVGSYSSKK
jgi:hypothetical protein